MLPAISLNRLLYLQPTERQFVENVYQKCKSYRRVLMLVLTSTYHLRERKRNGVESCFVQSFSNGRILLNKFTIIMVKNSQFIFCNKRAGYYTWIIKSVSLKFASKNQKLCTK